MIELNWEGDPTDKHIFKCGDDHELPVDESPRAQVKTWFSWGQKGETQIYGGNSGREFSLYCWIHDSTFTTLTLLYTYLDSVDQLVGQTGTLKFDSPWVGMTTDQLRTNCRFMGFERLAFDGQAAPTPLAAIGVDTSTYGSFHISGRLHFYQTSV